MGPLAISLLKKEKKSNFGGNKRQGVRTLESGKYGNPEGD